VKLKRNVTAPVGLELRTQPLWFEATEHLRKENCLKRLLNTIIFVVV